jgi:hypothetical protein
MMSPQVRHDQQVELFGLHHEVHARRVHNPVVLMMSGYSAPTF